MRHTKPCPACDEDMVYRPDIAGDDTHEWPCWTWVCAWCGHEGRTRHRKSAKWKVQ